MQGKVKWFNAAKGYGFIQPEGGGNDIFVHINAVTKAKMTTLKEGQALAFDLEKGHNGKTSAENLKAL